MVSNCATYRILFSFFVLGTVDSSPSFRQLCGGNIMAIEKLISFGKALQSTYKELVKDIGPSDENETLMKVINFSGQYTKNEVFH